MSDLIDLCKHIHSTEFHIMVKLEILCIQFEILQEIDKNKYLLCQKTEKNMSVNFVEQIIDK